MVKDKIKILFAIPFLFLIASCSNLINYSNNTQIDFSIDSLNSRYINQTLSQYRSFSQESKVDIYVNLLKNDQLALNDKRTSSIKNVHNETFSFYGLPYGEYQVEIEIKYNNIPLFYGKSNVIEISQDNLTPCCNLLLNKVMHKINYVLNGGELAADAETTYFALSNVMIPEPTRGEDKFVGWYLKEDFSGEQVTTLGIDSNITDDVTLYAKWNEYVPRLIISTEQDKTELLWNDKITISSSDPVTDIYYTTDKSDAETSPTRKLYTKPFDIMDDSTINAVGSYKGKIIKAQPKKYVRLYTVQFDVGGKGTVPPKQVLNKGELATTPGKLEAQGYIFKGWFTSKSFQEEFDFSAPITSDKTVYANWESAP